MVRSHPAQCRKTLIESGFFLSPLGCPVPFRLIYANVYATNQPAALVDVPRASTIALFLLFGQVCVNVGRRGNAAMPKKIRNILQIEAVVVQHCCGGMSKIMQTNSV